MPPGLAIETSGQVGSLALVDGHTILAEETFAHGLRHAAGIIPMIDRLVRQQNWKPVDIQHLYVSAGPGSFTGLRIGITVAKTVALVSGAKIVAVPTVRVLAENAPEQAKHLIIVLDARRQQIFTARFERTADGWIEKETAHLDSLAIMIQRSPRPLHLLGEGIPYHQQFIPDSSDVFITPKESWQARASVVAALGMRLAEQGSFTDPLQLSPIYVRRPEAEEKWMLQNNQPI